MSPLEAAMMQGRKRKHEDGEEAQSAPAKKSRSARRVERKQQRVREQPHLPRDLTLPLGEHRAKEKARSKVKRDKRKRERQEAANGTLVEATKPVAREDAVINDAAMERRDKRRQRKAEKKAVRQHAQKEDAGTAVKIPKQPKSKSKPKLRTKLELSNAGAGRFIDHDPLFVRDVGGAEYLIAAVQCELHVLSIETSLVVRTMLAPGSATITAFAIECPESNLLHIADSERNLLVWDWKNDTEPHFGPFSDGDLKSLAAARLRDDDEEDAMVPYITNLDGFNTVRLREENLYQTRKDLQTIQVLDGAEFIVARGAHTIVIGRRKEDKSYDWVELPLSKQIACMDARILPPPPGSKKAAKRLPRLQLAIGCEDGQIHLYDDVSSLLSQGQQQTPFAPRVLHWHRSSVSALKFNPDGNYLISGGKETVLVLWQLETGGKQFLPHLTSEIERISVNPRGDRYALQMGDNSIMVLSTAELKPVANFAGLQMRTVGAEVASSPAAALHPNNPNQLLVSVPPTQPKSAKEVAPRPFLQTFDLRTFRHVTRQALTRNNSTDFNTGPEGNEILSPDVAHLAISQDGQWLATVDEWMPASADVAHLASSSAEVEESRRSQREVYLKIWHWHAPDQIWTLSTRADAPHRRAGLQSLGAGEILNLVSDPKTDCFVTVGEDDCVKFWKPKTRIRGGVAMKDAQDADLIEWTCRRSVQLSSSRTRPGVASTSCSLASKVGGAIAAYSNDGSLLAVSCCAPEVLEANQPAIAFIDTATCTIKAINTALTDGTAIVALAFLERYLIVVTHKAAFIWDLVSDTMVRKIKLPQTPGSARRPQLAVNEADQTFALVTAGEQPEVYPSRVGVYSTKFTHRAFRQDFETSVVKVLSWKGSGGFVVLFADATIRTISPTMRGRSTLGALSAVLAESGGKDLDEPEENISEPVRLVASSTLETLMDPGAAFDEDDRPVVQPEELARVLDVGASFTLPPVKDMFSAVVGLFARKP